jgi:hypothetical protein
MTCKLPSGGRKFPARKDYTYIWVAYNAHKSIYGMIESYVTENKENYTYYNYVRPSSYSIDFRHIRHELVYKTIRFSRDI